MKKLTLGVYAESGHTFSLPLEAVTQKLAWLGVTGAGKTYAAMKLAELFWHAGAQFVALDPVGVWYGLRLAANGKDPSDIAVPIFGGLHKDLPLEYMAGAYIADLIVDQSISAVLDVSQFESDSQKARFAADFAARFFFRKKASPSAVHLFLEEVQEFAPQNTQRGEERMLHDFVRLQKLGRNFGIGSSYITQRPQEVNKKALNMAQTLFAFRTTGAHERKAVALWMTDKSLDLDIANDLPKLPTGSCHVWSPEFLNVSDVVRVHERETFNASSTPEVGAKAKARHLAPIDVESIRGKMAEAVERAKENDVDELRARIAKLTFELAAAKKVAPLDDRLQKNYDVLREQLGEMQRSALTLRKQNDDMRLKLNSVREHATELRDLATFDVAPPSVPNVPAYHPEGNSKAWPAGQVKDVQRREGNGKAKRLEKSGDASLSKMGRALLTIFAQNPNGLTREQALILSGYRPSGDTNAFFSRAASSGWLEGRAGVLVITRDGLQILGPYEPLPTGEALRSRTLASTKLKKVEREFLRVLFDNYPNPMTRADILAASGYRQSGDTNAAFSKFGKLGWVIDTLRGLVASETFF